MDFKLYKINTERQLLDLAQKVSPFVVGKAERNVRLQNFLTVKQKKAEGNVERTANENLLFLFLCFQRDDY